MRYLTLMDIHIAGEREENRIGARNGINGFYYITNVQTDARQGQVPGRIVSYWILS